MLTGKHTVRDVYCKRCRKTLGWKYVSTGCASGGPGACDARAAETECAALGARGRGKCKGESQLLRLVLWYTYDFPAYTP